MGKGRDDVRTAWARLRRNAAARTRRFRAMSPSGRRVAIARDVLSMVHDGTVRARHTYVQGPYVYDADVQVRDVLLSAGTACEACGIGAMFVAAALRDDDVTCADVDYVGWSDVKDVYWSYGWLRDDDALRKYLRRYFTDYIIDLVECAFEMDATFARPGRDRQTVVRAIEFGTRFDTMTSRLEAIMRNIVANGGRFVP